MRLEILVGDEDPLVYPLNNPKVTIGSSEQCDIVINADGVSRKHVGILSEGDKFLVVDLGSTNGSFINEERLIPGKRVELTSFFPVRLGQNVLLSLLSDEETSETVDKIEIPNSFQEPLESKKAIEAPEKTTVISLRELSTVKTEKLILMRNEKRLTKKKIDKPKVVKKNNNFFPYLALLIFVGGAAYNILTLKEKEVEEAPAEVGKIVNVASTEKDTIAPVESPPATKNDRLIPDDELTKKETYYDRLNEMKCTSDVEAMLCNFFPEARSSLFGAVQVGLSVHLLVKADVFYNHAKSIVRSQNVSTAEALRRYEDLVYDTTAYIYLLRSLEIGKLDTSKLEDYKIFIALFQHEEGTSPRLLRVIAIRPSAFNELKEIMRIEHLDLIKATGEAALSEVSSYYRTY